MPLEQNTLLVRRFYEEIINTGEVDRIESFVAPEYTEVYEGKRRR